MRVFNTYKDEYKVDQSDLAKVKNKISGLQNDIQHAVKMREHDPWFWDRERMLKTELLRVEQERLATLSDKFRNEQTADSARGYRIATPGFYGSDG